MDEELTKLVKVVTPGHDEWEERRARWNLFSQEAEVRIIVCPKDQDEVITIVNWARKHNQTDIGARAAGHGFFSSAAVVVDMREGFDYASVDEELGVATIGIGQTLGAIDERTAPWHVPLGVVSHTGGGLLLTGGVGYLTKAHGASADNILEVTIVTSDGSVHVCSKDNEPDLFFAVRGAAPNLGIVTQVKAKCYKHPDVTATLLAWPCTVENLKRLTNWSDQEAVLNDTNITPYIGFIPSPDKTPLVAMHAVCVGPPEEDDKYKALLGELEGTGEMALLPVSRVPFSTPQTIFDASFPTMYWYVSQAHNDADIPISDQSVEDLVEAYSKVPMDKGTHPLVALEQRGSKSAGYHQVASDDCAQPRAGQRWEIYVFFGTADQAHAETTRQEGRDMKQVILDTGFQAGGRVHLTNDEPSRIEYYYGSNSERVRAVVAKYDPIRLFASCNGMAF